MYEKNEIIKLSKGILPDSARLIYLSYSGSRLYGSNTTSSDLDVKGIYIESKNNLLLCKTKANVTMSTGKRNKHNTNKDIDIHLMSVHAFFKFLKKGEVNALELLFSMFSESILSEDPMFHHLISENYRIFLCKKTKAFIQYSLNYAKRNGLKSTRFNTLNRIVEILSLCDETTNIKDVDSQIRKELEVLSGCFFSIGSLNHRPAEFLEVFGKRYQSNLSISDFLKLLKIRQLEYGVRVQKCQGEKDWKALSHSVRVLIEVIELLKYNFIIFPLKETQLLLDIKHGRVSSNSILAIIEEKILEVEQIAQKSELPESPDEEKIDKLLLTILEFLAF